MLFKYTLYHHLNYEEPNFNLGIGFAGKNGLSGRTERFGSSTAECVLAIACYYSEEPNGTYGGPRIDFSYCLLLFGRSESIINRPSEEPKIGFRYWLLPFGRTEPIT